MAYLAKSTVLRAYQLLSDIDSDKRQGLTQKVSALKYASALDIYFRRHNQNCDLKQSSNRDLFASCVGEIVKINDEYCTKDFFLSVSPNGRDFDCGSNFFSQTSVKDSKTSPNETFLYPKRSGWQPVMDVQNQVLVYRSDYLHKAFSSYLGSTEQRLAFIIWILRFTKIAEDNMAGIKSTLNNLFTNEYCDALYTDAVNLSDTSYVEFNEEMCQIAPDDIQSLFNTHEELPYKKTVLGDFPLQTIYYGAPGTGKSNTIKREVVEKSRLHFRTTFHPDSDYSTFVGCYKPTKEKAPKEKYTVDELKLLFKEFKKTVSSRPEIRFAGRYHESLQDLSKDDIRKVFEGSQDSVIDAEIAKGIAAASAYAEAHKNANTPITYEFVPQAFTKAYCEAWNRYRCNGESEPVFLIIEEINRGNCAQIFGDIFQLLDRKGGFSEYPIDADEDLKKFLLNGTKEDGTFWLTNKDGIKDGQLCLPPNLYIWATMNTSDQSLFPIDSAFKRRWDWKYVKIKNEGKNWTIEGGRDWWEFLKKINGIIAGMTQSADKQLGYYFCKPSGTEISASTFVNKVCFYLCLNSATFFVKDCRTA